MASVLITKLLCFIVTSCVGVVLVVMSDVCFGGVTGVLVVTCDLRGVFCVVIFVLCWV